MEPRALIDVFDGDDHFVQRLRVTAWPLRIGRGLDNDLVLDDPFAAAYHAEIAPDETGKLIAHDLGSYNQLRSAQGMQRVRTLHLVTPCSLMIGHTRLRIRAEGDRLADEQPDRHDLWLTRPIVGVAGLIGVVGLEGAERWLEADGQREVAALLMPLLGVTAVVLIWSGAWALIGRLVSKRAEYLPHLGIGAVALLVFSLWGTLSQILSYAFALPGLTRYGYVAIGLIVGSAVFLHLNHSNPARPRLFASIAAVALASVIGFGMLTAYQRSARISTESYSASVFPPQLRFAKAQSIDSLIDRSTRLARLVSAERKPQTGNDDEDSED